jgi:hypothetical protein
MAQAIGNMIVDSSGFRRISANEHEYLVDDIEELKKQIDDSPLDKALNADLGDIGFDFERMSSGLGRNNTTGYWMSQDQFRSNY